MCIVFRGVDVEVVRWRWAVDLVLSGHLGEGGGVFIFAANAWVTAENALDACFADFILCSQL